MMRIALPALALIGCISPLHAETRTENGVRVHRMESAAPVASPERDATAVPIGLDPSYGARPSCSSMDWRLSVARATWEAACGDYGYDRWYDRWIYRGRY